MNRSKYFLTPLLILLLIPFTVLPPQEAFGAITFDNSDVTDGASDQCIVNALDVAVDDVVVIGLSDNENVVATPTVSDEDTHTWTERQADRVPSAEMFIFTTVITTANIANDITIDWSLAGVFLCVGAVYNGVDTTTPFNQGIENAIGSTVSIQLSLTPPDTGQIMVGVCASGWNNPHTQTFDSEATGTEREELTRGGSDKGSISLIDMVSFTNTNVKDWTCDHGASRAMAIGMIELNDAGTSPTINIDLMDVYEVDQTQRTTLGTGNVVCLDVDTDTAQTCAIALIVGHEYRIEIEVDETGSVDYTPTSFDFDSSVGNFDVFGTIVAGQITDSGCSTNTDWTESIVGGTDARSSSGTTCTINNGNAEWWMIVRIHTDTGGASSTSFTITITDGSTSDTSALMSFRTINIIE